MSSTYRETFDKLPISTKISNIDNTYKKVCLSDFFLLFAKLGSLIPLEFGSLIC